MTKFLLALAVILSLAAAASAGHRAGLFGTRERLVVRDRHVERERGVALTRLRGIVGGGCVGTVRGAGCAGVTVGAGCSGYVGPSLPVPPVGPVPAPMPLVPHKK